MTVEIDITDPRWDAAGLPAIAEAATNAALRHLSLDPMTYEVSLLACDDARIAELNTSFRDKPLPTNVLSWPGRERGPDEPGGTPHPPDPTDPELGDIAIAYETCEAEARAGGLSLADHTTHLIVHGTLHLLGYDHVHDADALRMEGIEAEILASLGVKDPY